VLALEVIEVGVDRFVSMEVVEVVYTEVEVAAVSVAVVEVDKLGIAGKVVSWSVSLLVFSRSFITPLIIKLYN
jgi:hypothetical protein